MNELIDTIAAATAECGMQTQLPKWVPPGKHEELREVLHDLAVGALTALADAKRGRFGRPRPSRI